MHNSRLVNKNTIKVRTAVGENDVYRGLNVHNKCVLQKKAHRFSSLYFFIYRCTLCLTKTLNTYIHFTYNIFFWPRTCFIQLSAWIGSFDVSCILGAFDTQQTSIDARKCMCFCVGCRKKGRIIQMFLCDPRSWILICSFFSINHVDERLQ